MSAAKRPGRVYLVGAGPGDPRLVTLRGLECLRDADLVLYDGLVDPLLLRYTHARTERTCRTGGPEGMRLDQEQINAQLVAAAKAGKTVVRLKGGDPFVFGRGGEEAAALRAAGVAFEVVPGITAATAVSAYAGISLTHRENASAVAFVTGHEDPTKPESSLDYDALARFPGTLVFYMGLHRLPEIAETLIAAGKDPRTPACAVSRGASPRQRTVDAVLSELPDRVAAAELRAPSLLVIGACVRSRDVADWFERLPLFGTSVGITRPDGQCDAVVRRCLELGAEPVLMPTIRIEPPEDFAAVDDVLDRLGGFDWIVFTSANGVDGLLNRLWEGGDARKLGSARIATIGPGTAEALSAHHLRADLVPDTYRAEALAEELAPHVTGRRVLWARSNRGRDVLPERLLTAGAQLEQLVVYRNEDVEAWPAPVVERIASGGLDWIGLSSPSIARHVARLLPESAGRPPRLASISPVTSEAAREAGLAIAAEADDFTWDGILAAVAAADR